MVLDGVADVPDYYSGKWASNLAGVDGAVEDFFQSCWAAGLEKCALWGNSTSAIAARTRDILDAVRQFPIPVYDASIVQYPILIGYEHVVFILFTSMYSPLSAWPRLAQVLVDVERRDGRSAAMYIAVAQPTIIGNTSLIAGLDAVRNSRTAFDTYEKWTRHVKEAQTQSVWAADAWSPAGVAIKDLEIYPPVSQQFNGTAFNVNTSAPILFVSNANDPVTPLPGAQKMHSLFPGSGLLLQNASGHTASLSAGSNCTLGYIGKYFSNGELPPANTTCGVETVPFVTEGQ